MQYLFNPYSSIFLVTSALSIVVAVVAWRRRSAPGGGSLAWLMFAVAEWNLVCAFESAAVVPANKIIWYKLQYVGANCTVVLLLISTLEYTNLKTRIKFNRLVWLWILPVINILMAATNEWHGWMWSGFSPSPLSSNLLVYHHGPWFWVMMAMVYMYITVTVVIIIREAIKTTPLQRNQLGFFLLGIFPPAIASLLSISGEDPFPGLNITPLSFFLTGFIILVSMLRFKLFDLVPIARNTLVEKMSDGVLVLDSQQRIVDINPAAQSLLDVDQTCLGEFAGDILNSSVLDFDELYLQTRETVEAIVQDIEQQRYIDMRITCLWDRFGNFNGMLVDLHDITQRYQGEKELQHANFKLKTQLEENEKLRLELREQAIRDPLTGLYNRRYLEETLPRELYRAARSSQPLSVLMIDIDNFKQINDTYGHQAGDKMLTEIGSLLRTQIRREDIACRYGGEEFLLVFYGISSQLANLRTKELLKAIRDLRVNYDNIPLAITVSAGVAAYPEIDHGMENLLRAADQALYTAKSAGRDRVKVWAGD
jgi:diguanylate cyclase (GGDEF)-like protein